MSQEGAGSRRHPADSIYGRTDMNLPKAIFPLGDTSVDRPLLTVKPQAPPA